MPRRVGRSDIRPARPAARSGDAFDQIDRACSWQLDRPETNCSSVAAEQYWETIRTWRRFVSLPLRRRKVRFGDRARWRPPIASRACANLAFALSRVRLPAIACFTNRSSFDDRKSVHQFAAILSPIAIACAGTTFVASGPGAIVSPGEV